MKKPTKSSFGWTVNGRWTHGNRDGYFNALKVWEGRKHGTGGRPRMNPVHESWVDSLSLFDSSDPTRSQGAFCRENNINRASFSTLQSKPITPEMLETIAEWAYVGDGLGLDGSWGTGKP